MDHSRKLGGVDRMAGIESGMTACNWLFFGLHWTLWRLATRAKEAPMVIAAEHCSTCEGSTCFRAWSARFELCVLCEPNQIRC